MPDHRAPRVPAALDRAPRAPEFAGRPDDVDESDGGGVRGLADAAPDRTHETADRLPAPYETEAPTDDLVLVAVALGAAALLVTLLSGLLPALGRTVQTTAWLLGATGLAVSVVAVRRRAATTETASRTAVAGLTLSAAALLLSAVLVVVGAAGQLT